MTNQKILYYTPWKISDGGIIASGLGYNGQDVKTKEHKFDRIFNINIRGVELESSPSIMMQVRTINTLIYWLYSTGIIKSMFG
jgi:hypothetical protein